MHIVAHLIYLRDVVRRSYVILHPILSGIVKGRSERKVPPLARPVSLAMMQELSRSCVKCSVAWPTEIEGLNYTTGSQLKINWASLSWPFRRLCRDAAPPTMRRNDAKTFYIHLIANNKIRKYTCDATSRHAWSFSIFYLQKNLKRDMYNLMCLWNATWK